MSEGRTRGRKERERTHTTVDDERRLPVLEPQLADQARPSSPVPLRALALAPHLRVLVLEGELGLAHELEERTRGQGRERGRVEDIVQGRGEGGTRTGGSTTAAGV